MILPIDHHSLHTFKNNGWAIYPPVSQTRLQVLTESYLHWPYFNTCQSYCFISRSTPELFFSECTTILLKCPNWTKA